MDFQLGACPSGSGGLPTCRAWPASQLIWKGGGGVRDLVAVVRLDSLPVAQLLHPALQILNSSGLGVGT